MTVTYFQGNSPVSCRLIVAVAAAVLLRSWAWPDPANAGFTCSSNQDCAATAAQCDPGATPCNDGVCDPASPDADSIGCVLVPNDARCDDGVFCNGAEICIQGHGCMVGPIPDCDDQVDCTTDRCSETLKKCTHTRHDSLCSDGLFCDGKETCDATRGCLPGTPPKCGDNVDCTTDFCDETNDVCAHVPDDTQCSDGAFCNGVEKCDVTLGCRPAPAPSCDDHVACTTDA